MSIPKIDRRIIKTRLTLQSSLVHLSIEKGFDNVTVQTIIDHAGVSRSTFYAHYTDKSDLLVASIQNLKASLVHQWKQDIEAGQVKGELRFVLNLLLHIGDSRHVWRGLSRGESARIIDREFRLMLAEMTRRDLGLGRSAKSCDEAVVACVVGSLMALIEAWMEDRVQGTAAEVSSMFEKLTIRGVNAVLVP